MSSNDLPTRIDPLNSQDRPINRLNQPNKTLSPPPFSLQNPRSSPLQGSRGSTTDRMAPRRFSSRLAAKSSKLAPELETRSSASSSQASPGHVKNGRPNSLVSRPSKKRKIDRKPKKAHTGVGLYRYVQLTEYEKLQQIFGDSVAHGGGSRTINQLDINAPVEVTNLDESQSPMHQFGFGDDDMAESTSAKPLQTSDSRRRESQSEENSGRTPKSHRSAIDGFLDAVNNLASIIRKRDEKEELIFNQCIEALDDIPTLSKDEYLAANDMLADSNTARSFINCKKEYRIDWIKRKMMLLD
ncbi:hypothetical protein QJS10_CPA01g02999 [Acorus calamus]|uniref:Uncharacterized protein n=1 Tax=Acorus calamus TaxID=4465 RepID=A0AAV9FRL3_ACOCL|nr:hypothetical protein QJS10_CPA01g02999 [Acorus calamus]